MIGIGSEFLSATDIRLNFPAVFDVDQDKTVIWRQSNILSDLSIKGLGFKAFPHIQLLCLTENGSDYNPIVVSGTLLKCPNTTDSLRFDNHLLRIEKT